MELMIAVAIIGVLTTLAMFAYTKYIKTARSAAEVPPVLAEFQLRQNQYAVENNGFFRSTGTNDTDYWPPTPSGSKVPTSIAGPPASWTELHITLDKQALYCSYVTRAGNAGDNTNIGGTATGRFNMNVAPAHNWFYVIAECDWNDDPATNEFWFVRSDQAGRQVVNRKN